MYAKVFQKMLDSSIWLECDSTRVVWLTLLLSMDSDGFAQFASVDNLARRARVKPSLTARAVATLEAPDPKSTTPDDDGRRIKRVQGGWIVINCQKYRNISSHGDLRQSRRKSEQPGATQRNSAQLGSPIDLSSNGINESVPETEKETEVKKEEAFGPEEVLQIAQAYPFSTYKSEFEIPHKNQLAIIECVHREKDWRLVLGYTQRYARSATNPNVVMGMDKFYKDPQNYRRQWQENGATVGKFTQLLSTVSEPYGEPGEQFGPVGDSESSLRRIPKTV